MVTTPARRSDDRDRISTFFYPGQPADLEVSEEERYPSQIEEVREDALVLTMPMRGTSLRTLPPDTPIQLVCPKRANRYFFKTKVLRNQFDPYPVVHLERPPDNSGAQLRAWARVDVLINDVQLWVEKDGQYGPTKKAVILDLSAGGCRVQLAEPLEGGTKITLRFTLPTTDKGWTKPEKRFARRKKSPYRRKSGETAETDELTVDGDVVRCAMAEVEAGKRYRAGVKFTSLAEADKDKIIRFVFQRELELRRRGAL